MTDIPLLIVWISSDYLSVPDSGADASLTANTALGLLRGLTTFEQLWYTSPSNAVGSHWLFNPLESRLMKVILRPCASPRTPRLRLQTIPISRGVGSDWTPRGTIFPWLISYE